MPQRKLQTAWLFFGQSINVILCKENPHFAQMRFHESAEFRNSAEHCCIDNSVTTNFFFFSLYISFLLSHPTLLLLCRENMKYLLGHRVLKAHLLHGNVAGIPDNGLQWWAKQPSRGNSFYVFGKAMAQTRLFTYLCRALNMVSLMALFYIKLISNSPSELINVHLKAEAQWREFLFYQCLCANLL